MYHLKLYVYSSSSYSVADGSHKVAKGVPGHDKKAIVLVPVYTVSTNTIREQVSYLKLGFARAGSSVTEERDVCGTLRVLLVVVLRPVFVGQLDQSVVVR